MLAPRTERSNAVQLVAKRSACFTLLHDGSTASGFRDDLLPGGGNQNHYFVSCPHLSTEPICSYRSIPHALSRLLQIRGWNFTPLFRSSPTGRSHSLAWPGPCIWCRNGSSRPTSCGQSSIICLRCLISFRQ